MFFLIFSFFHTQKTASRFGVGAGKNAPLELENLVGAFKNSKVRRCDPLGLRRMGRRLDIGWQIGAWQASI